jgi:hypothetical protein
MPQKSADLSRIQLQRIRQRYEDNIKIDVSDTGCLVLDGEQCSAGVNTVMKFCVP